ncbi:1,4-dihydroxy-2-naphthoate polyprenyltransferase [Salinicoccus jeotgali]|uniref:1,4-dihydroxy-2-naphthoate polyprenyltransferase n=1 Tax=Salinicoccus jeotgali TaxID=381634 RepID=A0ABP7EAR7_9STAP
MAHLLGYRNMASDFSYHSTWFRIIRPVTLTASIMPVTAGTLIGSHLTGLNFSHFIVVLITSVLIQAAVNMLNDYFDFMKGQEEGKWYAHSQYTSFLTPHYRQVPYVSAVLVFIVSILTLWLAANSSFWIIPLGITGLVLGYCYSSGRRSLSSLGLGEVAAAISLGPLPVIIAMLVQGAGMDWMMLIYPLPFALLMATMVLTNNIRDIEKDWSTRRTIAIRIGRERAIILLAVLLILTYISSLLVYSSMWVLLSLPAAVALIHRFYKSEGHNPMELAALHHVAHSAVIISAIILMF